MSTSKLLKIVSVVVLLLAFFGCSNSHDKNPVTSTVPIDDIPSLDTFSTGNRDIVAFYEATIDVENQTFTINPVDRIGSFHLPLNSYYPSVLQIVSFNFGPPFTANIKLKHPYPGSGIKGYDPRVIAIVPARTGVSMNYTTLGVYGNNKVVVKPDGYTRLFDKTELAGNINPFMAYFKDQAFREWASTGVTEETKTWTLNLAGFGGSMTYYFVVDVSTNFPNAPQPIVDNAPEPVQIRTSLASGLVPGGGSAQISVYLLDWQGGASIGSVRVESPTLFNGALSLGYQGPGPNPDEYTYTGTISNTLGAPQGKFNYLVAAWDQSTSIPIYQEFTDYVEYVPNNPQDITPSRLNGSASDTWIDAINQYAYIACGYGGLKIFDVSDIMHPVHIKTVSMTNAYSLASQDNYIFVVDIGVGLQIVNISSPYGAYITKTVPLTGTPLDICVLGEYAYVANSPNGLEIIDINPISSSYLVKTLDTPGYPAGVDVYGEYAYFSDGSSGLHIIDVIPPETANIVKTVDTPRSASIVDYDNGYVYIADWDSLEIVDVEPVGTASIVRSVDVPGDATGVHVVGAYAYVAEFQSDRGLSIININPPESAFIVNRVAMPGSASKVFVQNGYAWVSEYNIGVEIVDVDPFYQSNIVNTIPLLSRLDDICFYGNYAFAASGIGNGIYLLDITSPSSTNIIKYINLPNSPNDMVIKGDYGFVVTGNKFVILDIEPPEATNVVKSIDIVDGFAYKIDVEGDYAYITNGGTSSPCLYIADIEPPLSTAIIKTVPTVYPTYGVDYSNGYAYVTDSNGLEIIDVDPISSASIVKTVTASEARSVFVKDNYAYVSCTYAGYKIVNIENPVNAFVEKNFNSFSSYGSFVSGTYAYACDYNNVKIVDIYPLESAYVFKQVQTANNPKYVAVKDDVAWVCHEAAGLYILDLW